MKIPYILSAGLVAGLLAGCGSVAWHQPLQRDPQALRTEVARVTTLLLAAGEDDDIDDIDAAAFEESDIDETTDVDEVKKPPRAAKKGGTSIKVGLGMASPGTGAIGSAPSSTLPAYADVWDTGSALDIVGEFSGGTFYAQFSTASYTGLIYTNPNDANDSYLLSDAALTFIGGGAKFGTTFYGRIGAGIVMWPEVERIDASSGWGTPVLAATTGFALALGGGAEIALGSIKAYADLEYAILPAPEKAENAVVFWPQFEAEGMSVISFKTGVGITF